MSRVYRIFTGGYTPMIEVNFSRWHKYKLYPGEIADESLKTGSAVYNKLAR